MPFLYWTLELPLAFFNFSSFQSMVLDVCCFEGSCCEVPLLRGVFHVRGIIVPVFTLFYFLIHQPFQFGSASVSDPILIDCFLSSSLALPSSIRAFLSAALTFHFWSSAFLSSGVALTLVGRDLPELEPGHTVALSR